MPKVKLTALNTIDRGGKLGEVKPGKSFTVNSEKEAQELIDLGCAEVYSDKTVGSATVSESKELKEAHAAIAKLEAKVTSETKRADTAEAKVTELETQVTELKTQIKAGK